MVAGVAEEEEEVVVTEGGVEAGEVAMEGGVEAEVEEAAEEVASTDMAANSRLNPPSGKSNRHRSTVRT